MNQSKTIISAYKFVNLDKLATLKAQLLAAHDALDIKGTILLAPEGINVMLSAPEADLTAFLDVLRLDARLADLTPKYSYADAHPFERFKVRIKKEIITMGDDSVNPLEDTAEHLSPQEFKQWLDDGRDMTILDTRNHYEVEEGTFANAIDFDLENFRDFPAACDTLDPSLKDKPLVMFCTGGVRCEKAAVPVKRLGFRKVYQLDGGIIKYFEECGGAHYNGNCFVFDERVLLNPNLETVEKETNL